MVSVQIMDHVDALVHHLDKTEDGTDQARIAVVGLKLVLTLLRKNESYGSSVFAQAVIAPDVKPEAGIRVRMSDKIARIQSLLSPEKKDCFESLEDAFLDLAGYSILWAVSHTTVAKPPTDGMNRHALAAWLEDEQREGPAVPPNCTTVWPAVVQSAYRDGWHQAFHTIIEKILKTP